MLYNLLKSLHKKSAFQTAQAHCDIPCKIYDPISAQLSALSIIRFIDIVNETQQKEVLSLNDQAQLIRLINEKEVHAAKVKDEVRIIWGDFFKQPQFEQFPDTHQLVHSIMLTASACKQHVDREKAEQLLTLVNQFAASFWQAKGFKTYQATSPYPPQEKLVYPALQAE